MYLLSSSDFQNKVRRNTIFLSYIILISSWRSNYLSGLVWLFKLLGSWVEIYWRHFKYCLFWHTDKFEGRGEETILSHSIILLGDLLWSTGLHPSICQSPQVVIIIHCLAFGPFPALSPQPPWHQERLAEKRELCPGPGRPENSTKQQFERGKSIFFQPWGNLLVHSVKQMILIAREIYLSNMICSGGEKVREIERERVRGR